MRPDSGTEATPSRSSSLQADSRSSLARDQVVRGIVVLCVLAAVPIVIPILSDEWRAVYGRHIVDLPFLAALLVAIRFRLRGVREETERRFWNLLTFGFACWLGVQLVNIVYRDLIDSQTIRQIVNNVPYLLFFGATAAALEIQPHVRSDRLTRRLRGLDRVGSFVFLFGLLLYFLVLPGILSRNSLAFWPSSLALFVALDTYIVLRLSNLRQSAADGEWRTIYSWLLVAAIVWGIGDAGMLLMFEGILTDPGWGSPFDLIWPLAFSAVVAATRPGDHQPERRQLAKPMRQPLGMGPLVVYAVAPPLFHVAVYRFGSPDLAVRPSRDLLVIGFATVLAALAFGYHRLLRIENRRLGAEEAKAKEKFVHQAFHDELTGLPNRNMFRDHLRLAIADSRRYERKCAVLFCDLDPFKVINDSLGHEAGDQALVSTSQRLESTVRELDTVARFGGDEFTIILHGIREALDAAWLAEKLLAAVSEPLLVKGKKHVLTTSLGIAVFPDDGGDEETLLKNADTAMYQAKLQGGNAYRLFTKTMNEAAEERLAIEQGLRAGLMDDHFVVVYQPIIELATGQPMGYEALLRWNHPERGCMAPGSFLDVAEQTGLIVPIGRRVLETACAWAVQMDSTAINAPSIAVNVSSRQLHDPGLAKDVKKILQRTGLAPSRLRLEITESMALTIDSSAVALAELRDLGIRIAIDDFGTGYTAVSLLTDFPMDMVKIDGSFVRGIEADAERETIVLTIVRMARALDLYVVAECVETDEELAVLQRSQCDAVQGFLFCGPMPPEELKAVMALQ